MSLFNFGRALSVDKQKSELSPTQDFDLAGTGGFLSVIKYLVFAILASLNFHLFFTHAPGVWGVLIGCVALMFEACAIYFWNKQNKSAGSHQIALQAFAITFTVLSFVHGTAALYQLAGVGRDINEIVEIYSRYVAFPLLFGLMVLAVCTLYFFHWSTGISNARAKAMLEMERRRAELMTESMALESEAMVENQRLEHFKRKVLLEEEYALAAEDYAKVKQRQLSVLNAITDPETRADMLHAIGRVSTGSGPAQRRINPLPAAGANDPKDQAPNQE
jgi:hypothetical protein